MILEQRTALLVPDDYQHANAVVKKREGFRRSKTFGAIQRRAQDRFEPAGKEETG